MVELRQSGEKNWIFQYDVGNCDGIFEFFADDVEWVTLAESQNKVMEETQIRLTRRWNRRDDQ
jgi:hypothetical protein